MKNEKKSKNSLLIQPKIVNYSKKKARNNVKKKEVKQKTFLRTVNRKCSEKLVQNEVKQNHEELKLGRLTTWLPSGKLELLVVMVPSKL